MKTKKFLVQIFSPFIFLLVIYGVFIIGFSRLIRKPYKFAYHSDRVSKLLGYEKMVKINQGLSDFQEIEDSEQYQIVNVSENTQKGFKGLTIEFKPKKQTPENKDIQYRTTAWLGQNDTVGTRSKLGCFISAFTDYFEGENNNADTALFMASDTDNWKNHYIKVISWKSKNREIKVIS